MKLFVFKSLIPIILFSLLSCRDTSREKPRHYNDQKLIAVMIDLYAAEAALNDIKEVYSDSLKHLYREQIATIHDVDITMIEEDLEQLQSDLLKYEELHQVVKDSIYAIEKRRSALFVKNAKKYSGKKEIEKQLNK